MRSGKALAPPLDGGSAPPAHPPFYRFAFFCFLPLTLALSAMEHLESLSISALQAAYASGSSTPTTLIRTLYSRIDAYKLKDPAVWIDICPLEDALTAASALEKRYDGREKPPLYGVPFSVKNSIDVADYKTTLACESFAYVAEKTAPVVQRCLDAGGIFVGTTNLDQFATGLVGHRSPYGTPRCVFDDEYISGGSSSGSAVAVGAGLCSLCVFLSSFSSTFALLP